MADHARPADNPTPAEAPLPHPELPQRLPGSHL
jgi:hypothetical protein